MLKNYIKIALRDLRKNKIDSNITIGGLDECFSFSEDHIRFQLMFYRDSRAK